MADTGETVISAILNRAGVHESGRICNAHRTQKESDGTGHRRYHAGTGRLLKPGYPSDSLIVLSFLMPPLAVYLDVGIGDPFWLNLLLTLMGFVPGVIHALIVVI